MTLALAGCDGSGGTVSGLAQSCHSVSGTGSCGGAIRRVTGRAHYRLEELPANRGTPVLVQVQASVESGTLRLELLGPDDAVERAVAAPDAPAELVGLGVVDTHYSVPVVMEALDDREVTGVQFTVAWEVQ